MKRSIRFLLAILTALFSFGWAIPMFLSIKTIITWGQNEVNPTINHLDKIENSFPHLEFANESLNIAIVWFIIVAISWSSYLIRSFILKKPMIENTNE